MSKARIAYLVNPKKVDGVEGEAKVELREYDIPTPGEGEILVKVEGCGICGTDVHEYRYDPFGMCPVVLGHEGTGEVVAIGAGVTTDTKGDPIKVGDKVVTSVLLCGDCDYCRRYPENPMPSAAALSISSRGLSQPSERVVWQCKSQGYAAAPISSHPRKAVYVRAPFL